MQMQTAIINSITVSMSAFNEEDVVADTIADCAAILAQLPGEHEILIVDDGSTDHTGEVLADLAKKMLQLRVLVHPKNRGLAKAEQWLTEEAKGNLIFDFASDGEWRAQELHSMLAKLNEGYDIVIGARRIKHYTVYRKIVSWLFNTLVCILYKKNFRDIGGIFLARAEVWKSIPVQSTSAFFMAEKLVLAHRNGASIGFCPVDHVWRSSGKSKFNNPLRAIEAFVDLFKFWLSPRSRQKIHLRITAG